MSAPATLVITGASSGIGRAASAHFVRRGYHVFGSVRRTEDAARLKAEIGAGFTPLLFDVRDEAAIARARDEVEAALGVGGLAGLVNNAGMAVPGPLTELTVDEFRTPFEVNVLGTLRVTRAFLPLLGTRPSAPFPPGRIVNVSSISGWHTFPFNTPYSVSKYGLESLSDGLRRELAVYGIDVIVIVPGAIKTPIWDKVDELDIARFENSVYYPALEVAKKLRVEIGRRSLPVERVSRALETALESPRPTTRYRVIGNPLREWILPRWLPDRWWDRLLWKTLGLPVKTR